MSVYESTKAIFKKKKIVNLCLQSKVTEMEMNSRHPISNVFRYDGQCDKDRSAHYRLATSTMILFHNSSSEYIPHRILQYCFLHAQKQTTLQNRWEVFTWNELLFIFSHFYAIPLASPTLPVRFSRRLWKARLRRSELWRIWIVDYRFTTDHESYIRRTIFHWSKVLSGVKSGTRNVNARNTSASKICDGERCLTRRGIVIPWNRSWIFPNPHFLVIRYDSPTCTRG